MLVKMGFFSFMMLFSIYSFAETSILDFGAISAVESSSAAVNRVAIQKTIDHVAHLGGGVVFIPAGSYFVDGTINLRSRVSLRGESREVSAIRCAGENSQYPLLRLEAEPGQADGWGQNGSFSIEDLSLFGNRIGFTRGTGTGILLVHVAHVRIHDVVVNAFTGFGIHIRSIGYSSIEDCAITNAGRDCIWLESISANDACTSTRIRDCQVSSGTRSSIHVSNGINIIIDGCEMEDSGYDSAGWPQSRTITSAAFVLDGMMNRSVILRGNYFEFNKSPYFLALGDGAGFGIVVCDNFFAPEGTKIAQYTPLFYPAPGKILFQGNNRK